MRPIDADKLAENMRKFCGAPCRTCIFYDIRDMTCRLITEAPTIQPENPKIESN